MNAIIVIGIMAVSALMILVALHLKAKRAPASQESATVILVKRRRELRTELHRMVGCDMEAARIVREEAKRLQKPSASIEALEAAIKRIEVEQAFDRG